jgi:hypothetical protein
MKVNVSSDELVELFVRQSQPYAQASSARFDGKKLISYSTVMAMIVKDKQGHEVFLLNGDKYSNTTSTLQGRLKAALPLTARVISVPGVDRWSSESFADKRRILKVLGSRRVAMVADAEKSKEPKRTRLLLEAEGLERTAEQVQALAI